MNYALESEIRQLSNIFGPFEPKQKTRRPDQYVASNDSGYELALQHLHPVKSGDIGFVVGTGGILSILPFIMTEIVIAADINPVVLEFLTAEKNAISDKNSPEDALKTLFSLDFLSDYPLLATMYRNTEDLHYPKKQVTLESESFGEYHWTNQIYYDAVRKQVKATEIIGVRTNIKNPYFAQALSNVMRKFGKSIGFLNFTNVHERIAPYSMDFIKGWPIRSDANIMFSSWEDNDIPNDLPRVRVVKGMNNYVRFTDRDPTVYHF